MIISVPHSGTRSLRDHLGEDGYWHWGQNDIEIERHVGHVDVPLRDPFDVAVSWEARYRGTANMPAEELIRRLNMMLAYDELGRSREDINIKYWCTDKLPIHEGKGEPHWARTDRNAAMELDRVSAVIDWYGQSDAVQALYRPLFPEGFWWA